ncbi:elongation factor Ts [Streptomyces sp. NBRC 110611]|nr:elongation factor Ts [Streptomyces sp. NBRC 110611]
MDTPGSRALPYKANPKGNCFPADLARQAADGKGDGAVQHLALAGSVEYLHGSAMGRALPGWAHDAESVATAGPVAPVRPPHAASVPCRVSAHRRECRMVAAGPGHIPGNMCNGLGDVQRRTDGVFTAVWKLHLDGPGGAPDPHHRRT